MRLLNPLLNRCGNCEMQWDRTTLSLEVQKYWLILSRKLLPQNPPRFNDQEELECSDSGIKRLRSLKPRAQNNITTDLITIDALTK
jgi:hypothetical protein